MDQTSLFQNHLSDSMTIAELQNVFESPFDWTNWRKVMDFVFPEFNFFSTEEALPLDTNLRRENAESIKMHGKTILGDNGDLVLYEIALNESVRLDRNVKSVRKLIASEVFDSYRIGIAVFHSPDKSKWRFTLVIREFNEAFNVVDKKPESYTYVFGEGEKGRTAAERFHRLAQVQEKTLADLEEAFSVEALSKKFFDQYKKLYEAFKEDIEQNPSKLAQFAEPDREKSARDFVKKMMGRIVFLYFLQKKGWMGCSTDQWDDGDEQFMPNLFRSAAENDDAFYTHYLEPLFFDTLNRRREDQGEACIIAGQRYGKVPFLNGGLFEREDQHPDLLMIDWNIFHRLFEVLDSYNFTIVEDDPDYKEVAVDPEMLGHIFENLLEDNKDKGAFYTPKEIVQYMCQESLIEYLITQLREKGDYDEETLTQGVRELVVKQELARLNDEDQRTDRYVLQSLRDVKVCDPAIGSGAFPMGILQEIFRLVEFLQEDRDIFLSIWQTEAWNPARTKEDIIQNSIYGVDIEKGAVDIARLRFWLSIIIDEDKPRPLPNLDYKIVVGNSLLNKFEDQVIDIAWEVKAGTQVDTNTQRFLEQRSKLLNTISEKQKAYFDAASADRSILAQNIKDLKIDILTNQIQIKIEQEGVREMPKQHNFKKKKDHARALAIHLETLKWQNTIADLQKIKGTHKSFHHFDWELDFPEVLNPIINPNAEQRGFDIVIGNPPYVQLQRMGEVANVLQKAGYQTFIRTGDIYCLFYEAGYEILKKGSVLAYITPVNWMRSNYGKVLRKYFTKEGNPLKLIDFGGYKVFQNATINTGIVIAKKGNSQAAIQSCLLDKNLKSLNYLSDYFRQHSCIQKDYGREDSWIILPRIELQIKQKIEKVGIPLRQWEIRINRGILTGLNEAFIIDSKTREKLIREDPKSDEIIRPILRGRDIKKYSVNFADKWILNTHNGVKSEGIGRIEVEKDYPSVYSYLSVYHEQLTKRLDQGNHWANLRNCAYLSDLEQNKIIWIELTDNANFYLDTEGYYINNTVFFMIGNKLPYILSFLNSSLCEWYFQRIAAASGAGTRRWIKMYVEQIPVPLEPGEHIEQELTILVRDIQNRLKMGLDVNELKQQVDKVILRLYNFKDEELEYLIDSFRQ